MLIKEQSLLKINLSKKKKSCQIIILNINAPKNSKDRKILGRANSDWVLFACSKYKTTTYDYDRKSNILEFVLDKVDAKHDYTLVLPSYIPLITSDVIDNIIEFAFYKDINLCKLPVGYIFNNNYILTSSTYNVDSVYSQNIEYFYIVENKKQYSYALNILQDRINNFHMDNGVEIINTKSVYIEPDVDISAGVIIYSNNSLKGNTLIESNVILKENNVIDNSKIGADSCISGSVIDSTTISNNVYIASFCDILNSRILSDVIIERGCSIKNYSIKSGQKIKANSLLGE